MLNWSNISLFQFQEADKINSRKDIDDLDKLLFITCTVFKLTEYQLDNMEPRKAGKLIGKVEKIFKSEFKPVPTKRVGRYFVEYDVSKLCLGQYVELSHFLQGNIIQNAHYILASITHEWLRRNDAGKHRKKAEYFLHKPIASAIGSVTLFIEKFTAFNKEYKNLFGLDREGNGNVDADPFNKHFGWQFSAREVAHDEGIPLEQAYGLPIRQALNSLTYLKAKGQYEERQMKYAKKQAM